MDFNATIDLIIKDLDEARTIIDDLKKYPGVPVLQVELAKSKCKSAGEVIALLKNLEESSETDHKTATANEIRQEQAPVAGDEPRPEIFEIEAEPEQEQTQIKSVTPQQNLTGKQSAGPVEELVKAAEKASESSIIADRFVHLASSINEQIGSHIEDDISGILKAKPVSSLTEAIGINDRFLFIREIFNGDREAYNQALEKLESAQNLGDAKAVLMSYTGNSTESEASKQLLDLVKRKFPLHG